ncbi:MULTISPECIES: hypothetical protein [unclassified Cupriavidus]|uniref:arsenate reductase/protein-tyrosine-phosphatase family protein n=1 Tax=unclassified Cupriavidus TaxID=2640874 RepID=UPI001AE983CC|nr:MULTISPECIES: hypothetical protein [unclassified Cupriavidus]MBP0633527.1 hypothetical protein [Cupriavidus sp. AcVe19-1a]MBP0640226.1 hypothetical protein [Cupriavidus sp. AcVe19-6a]
MRQFKVVLLLALLTGITHALAQSDSGAGKTILVVDRGNIQRSVVAEVVLQKVIEKRGLGEKYRVISRGMQGTPAIPEIPPHNNLKFYTAANGSAGMEWENAERTLRELGLTDDLVKHRATVLSRSDLEKAAIVMALDTPTISDPKYGINVQFPGFSEKVMLFTELTGCNEGIADGAGANDANRHRQLILDIDRIAREGFDNLVSRIEK